MRRGYEELQEPAGLGEGPQVDPRDLPGHTRLSKRGTIWFDQLNPAFVCFDRGELGGRLWPKIRRRDGPFHPDLDGFRSTAFLSSVTSAKGQELKASNPKLVATTVFMLASKPVIAIRGHIV